jgi:hypothetical protein
MASVSGLFTQLTGAIKTLNCAWAATTMAWDVPVQRHFDKQHLAHSTQRSGPACGGWGDWRSPRPRAAACAVG